MRIPPSRSARLSGDYKRSSNWVSTMERTPPRPADRLAIFGGRSHPAFVAAICQALGQAPGRARLRTFSDGAIEVKIDENVRGGDVFIVQSGQANPNDHLVELLFL